MADVDTLLRRIICRTVSLGERISSYKEGSKFHATVEGVSRTKRWEAIYRDHPQESFSRRLAALGLSLSELPEILGAVGSDVVPRSEEWVSILRAILIELAAGHTVEASSERSDRQAAGYADVLYQELYLPVVGCARRMLDERVTDAGQRIGPEAWIGLEHYLLGRLTTAGSQIITVRFAAFKTMAHFGFGVAPTSDTENDKAWFRAFVGRLPGRCLFEIFEQYPVHANHCAMLVLQWIRAMESFLLRLAHDYPELCVRFGKGTPPGFVVEAQAGLSDAHDDGQSVIAITFTTGVKVIYKPRSLAIDEAFLVFLRRLGERQSFRHFHCPVTWDRGDYGWAEYVTAAPCRDAPSIKRFYWRAGALLGLIYLGRGVDCHQENLIAHGEYPVLIDLETLWHPAETWDFDEQVLAHSHQIDSAASALRTGFLPAEDEESKYSVSALGGIDTGNPTRNHLPVLGTCLIPATDHVAEIQAGFRWIGRNALADGTAKQNFICWLRTLALSPRRRVLRTTMAYTRILEAACNPNNLKDMADFDIFLEALRVGQNDSAVVDLETSALSRFDIPRFNQASDVIWQTEKIVLPSLDLYLGQLDVIRNALQKSRKPFTRA